MRRLPCRALSKLQSKYFHLWLRRRWCLQRTPFDHHQAASCYELAIATLLVSTPDPDREVAGSTPAYVSTAISTFPCAKGSHSFATNRFSISRCKGYHKLSKVTVVV
ncbi:hypothetical protein KCU70_g400, partial [Aureobasidium melanogenum]